MMHPFCLAFMPGSTAWINRRVPKKFTSNNSFAISIVVHSNGVINPSPALLTDEYQHALVETLRYTVSVYRYGYITRTRSCKYMYRYMASYPGYQVERWWHYHTWEIIVAFCITGWEICSPNRTRRQKRCILKSLILETGQTSGLACAAGALWASGAYAEGETRGRKILSAFPRLVRFTLSLSLLK